jgi:hypothetical protein
MQWSNGKLDKVTIKSVIGMPLKIRYGTIVKTIDVKKGDRIVLDGNLDLVKNEKV